MGREQCANCGRVTPAHYKRMIHKKTCPYYQAPLEMGQRIKRTCACGNVFVAAKHVTCWTCRGRVDKDCIRCGKNFHLANSDICTSCIWQTRSNRLCTKCDRPINPRSTTGLCEECRRHNEYHEPTQEEVDRCVAEQMQCLPSWWDKESRKRKRKGKGIDILKIEVRKHIVCSRKVDIDSSQWG
jgi:hypothetical protein